MSEQIPLGPDQPADVECPMTEGDLAYRRIGIFNIAFHHRHGARDGTTLSTKPGQDQPKHAERLG